jgi:hypothetical protein
MGESVLVDCGVVDLIGPDSGFQPLNPWPLILFTLLLVAFSWLFEGRRGRWEGGSGLFLPVLMDVMQLIRDVFADLGEVMVLHEHLRHILLYYINNQPNLPHQHIKFIYP